MDERGFITRMVYDIPTGAIVRRIDDVDTSLYGDVPSGWVTPTGGGLNLITDYENDSLGRQIQELGPVHTIDLNGTAHTYDYDKLARQTQDRITTLGSGVDGAVRRIATTYEVRGQVAHVTSYDNPTVGQGNIVNDDLKVYNDFEQLAHEYQAHSGAVDTGSTPNVGYAYANGSANIFWLTPHNDDVSQRQNLLMSPRNRGCHIS